MTDLYSTGRSATTSGTPDPAERRPGFATRQLHAGECTDEPHRPRATPIHLSAGFVFEDLEEGRERFAEPESGYSYTRLGNPTTSAVERRVADLESGAGGLLLGSGQAAVTVALLSLAESGDHLLLSDSLYEGTRELVRDELGRLGIAADFVTEPDDPVAWERAIRPRTRLLFVESVPNPRNDVPDIRSLAELAHRHGLPLVVDNTLATPYLLRPIEHGADIVIHSASKFLAGHGTVLGGLIVDGGLFPWSEHAQSFPRIALERGADGRSGVERWGAEAFLGVARKVAMRYGPAPSPLNAFLILQGVETLCLRVQRQSDTALRLARWLAARPEVESVHYSGLPDSPHHDTARRYLPHGQGSVFAVTLRGGLEAARACMDGLRLFTRMTHVGDVRSLVLHPASTTHALRDERELLAAGIGPGTLRLSIGLEDPEDLIADLQHGLAVAEGSSA